MFHTEATTCNRWLLYKNLYVEEAWYKIWNISCQLASSLGLCQHVFIQEFWDNAKSTHLMCLWYKTYWTYFFTFELQVVAAQKCGYWKGLVQKLKLWCVREAPTFFTEDFPTTGNTIHMIQSPYIHNIYLSYTSIRDSNRLMHKNLTDNNWSKTWNISCKHHHPSNIPINFLT